MGTPSERGHHGAGSGFSGGQGPAKPARGNKHYALAGFWRHAISRGHATRSPLPITNRDRPSGRRPISTPRRTAAALRSRDRGDQPPRRGSVDAVTFRTLLLLLYGAGLRFREATRLTLTDVDLTHAVLTVRATKFYKSRLVPVGPQLATVLDRNVSRRRRGGLRKARKRSCSRTGMDRRSPAAPFRRHSTPCGASPGSSAHRWTTDPRLHDLRHSFAVHSLTGWYRQGADVQRLLPVLSTYLGHADLEGTKVYLSMTPELLQQASLRFARYAGGGQGCVTS